MFEGVCHWESSSLRRAAILACHRSADDRYLLCKLLYIMLSHAIVGVTLVFYL
jgi:hypothetical protein